MKINNLKYFFISLFLTTTWYLPSYGRQPRVLYPVHFRNPFTEMVSGDQQDYQNISKNPKEPDLLPFEDPKTKLMGYKNRKGTIVIPPQYSATFGAFNIFGTALVRVPNVPHALSFYSIDKKGRLLFRYYSFDNGPDTYCAGFSRYVSKNGKMGFVNVKGKIAIPAVFDFAESFGYNIPATFACKGGFEVCNLEFEKGLQHKSYECCHDKTWKGGIWYLIDQKGKVLLADAKPLWYEDLTYEHRDQSITIIHDKKQYKLYHDARNRIYLVAVNPSAIKPSI